jgi:hypothetical protein
MLPPVGLLWVMSLTTPSTVALDAGSVQIDEAFERHAEKCLKDIKLEHPRLKLPDHVAHIMARGPDFQAMKTNFQRSSTLTAMIPVPENSEIRVKVSP